MSFLKKLVIGSAQFGLDYGVTNDAGIVLPEEVRDILKEAVNRNVLVIDTARGYGQSESIIGEIGCKEFEVITKFSKLPSSADKAVITSSLKSSLMESCQKLKVQRFYGVLAHDAEDFIEKAAIIIPATQELKHSGLIGKFGVSVYRPEQVERVLNICTPDIIQFPLNVFDQRFIDSKILNVMHSKGIECHVRSVFLQGVNLSPLEKLHPFFDFMKPHYIEYNKFLQRNGISALEGALHFVLANPLVDKVLVGICSLKQFTEINAAVDRIETFTHLNYDEWKFHDERLINPLMWPMLKR